MCLITLFITDKRTFIPGIFFFKGCRSCAIDRLGDSFIHRFPTFCCSIRCRRSLDLAALSLRTTCAGHPCRWPLNLTSLSLSFICAGHPCRRSLSFAIVFVNSNQHNYEFDQVQVDFDRGQEQMVSYLLDQKQYTGLGYIGGIYDGANGRIGTHRLAAIRRILEKRGQYDPRTFHVGEISRESGYALAKKAVEEHTLAEAVLLGSDEVAEGALEAFRELGVRVPKDVAVIIYQDIQTLESKWPTGTCLEMFPDYVWENALELLFGRISQRRSQAVTVTVPTHLKIGDTA